MTAPPVRPDDELEAAESTARLHLFMEASEDRRLLADLLEPAYDLSLGSLAEADGGDIDLCIVDVPTFRRERDVLDRLKDRTEKEFFPVLLLAEDRSALGTSTEVWSHADDVVELPVRKDDLQARLENLLQRRRTTTRLAERERDLERTVADLERKERAMDAAPVGITLTDPTRADNPTVYANAAFERITGYDRNEALGRNMRFLQGAATDEESVATLRDGIAAERAVATTLVNYRADGTRFWNRVEVAPVYGESGELVNFVGFQTDVTEEKVREQRLAVLNRVMRHNLSNDINVVQGHAEDLLETVEDEATRAQLESIRLSAGDLERLGDAVARAEHILERCRDRPDRVEIGALLAEVHERVADAHPEATLSLDVEGGPWHVGGSCLEAVFVELLENAIVHNGGAEPTVSTTVGRAPVTDGHVAVRIHDDGPGMPDGLVDVFRDGEETPLNHGDGLGLWIVHWVVTLLGGTTRIDTGDGTTVSVTLPTVERDVSPPADHPRGR